MRVVRAAKPATAATAAETIASIVILQVIRLRQGIVSVLVFTTVQLDEPSMSVTRKSIVTPLPSVVPKINSTLVQVPEKDKVGYEVPTDELTALESPGFIVTYESIRPA